MSVFFFANIPSFESVFQINKTAVKMTSIRVVERTLAVYMKAINMCVFLFETILAS